MGFKLNLIVNLSLGGDGGGETRSFGGEWWLTLGKATQLIEKN